MRIVVVGTRGIPEIQGGVETHCQELYPRLVALGHDVYVIRRSSYVTPTNKADSYKGVKLIDVFAPRKKSFEAIVHTFLAVIKARSLKPDIVHFHAIGPSLLVPFARILGMKVVMTNHGPDYDRQKWGRLAKFMLRSGEKLGTKYANRIIVISDVIRKIASRLGRNDTELIFNGVVQPRLSTETDYIETLGLQPGRYVVAMGRFVEEKGFHYLIDAFNALAADDYKLVIAGDADHPDSYSRLLKAKALESGTVLTGFIRGKNLNQLMSHAALYVMPSFHEGLPIALLEALSYGLPVIVSDIPANKLPIIPSNCFFPTGSIQQLTAKLREKLSMPPERVHYNLSNYDWDRIALQTQNVYREILAQNWKQ